MFSEKARSGRKREDFIGFNSRFLSPLDEITWTKIEVNMSEKPEKFYSSGRTDKPSLKGDLGTSKRFWGDDRS